MTRLPRVYVQFQDGQLGLVTPSGAEVHAKIGVATSGVVNLAARFTRASQVAEEYVGGPLAGAIAVALAEASPVIGVRAATSVAGVVSAVTKTGAGTSTMTVTGAPTDALDVLVTVTRAAASTTDGTGAVQITIAGQDLGERALPVNGQLPITGSGVTLAFSAGTLAVGATYAFTATAPGSTLDDIVTALQALIDRRPRIRFVHILGAATPALAAAVDTLLKAAETRNYYLHALLEARPMNAGETQNAYDAALDTQWASFSSTRIAVAKAGGFVYNPLTKRSEIRSAAWKASARRVTVPIGEDASRVRTGALVGITGLVYDANLTGDPGRFVALRTFDAREGFYVAAWPLMSPTGSDYDAVQSREVIDEAARVGYDAALDYLGDDVPVDSATGLIVETEAQAFESFVTGRVRAALGGNASGVRVTVDRTEPILQTKRFEFDLGVIPLGYMTEIQVRVGYVNPAHIAQTAAPIAAGTTPTGGGTT
ncbi:DUF2586 family protein [Deinococcus pimensis]|uniref:DUF2586 family protein n=1 Tax=Deinococcus pimensis TaxID=309888 RepID=UPI0004818CF7|nr:DUF2586 family protein [Deinococcus pimensis]